MTNPINNKGTMYNITRDDSQWTFALTFWGFRLLHNYYPQYSFFNFDAEWDALVASSIIESEDDFPRQVDHSPRPCKVGLALIPDDTVSAMRGILVLNNRFGGLLEKLEGDQ